MNTPPEPMVRVRYFKGPLDGQSILVPKKALETGSAMPIGDSLAVYAPQTRNGETAFVFERWVKNVPPPDYSVFHHK